MVLLTSMLRRRALTLLGDHFFLTLTKESAEVSTTYLQTNSKQFTYKKNLDIIRRGYAESGVGGVRGVPKQFHEVVNAEVMKNYKSMDADELRAAQQEIIQQAQSQSTKSIIKELSERESFWPNIFMWTWFIGFNLTVIWALWYAYTPPKDAVPPRAESVSNWSGTHATTTKRYFEPDSEELVEELVYTANEGGQRIRPIGSALSPNAVGFSSDGMISLALLDKVIKIDETKKQITVQAGARIEKVVEALRPFGLTLQNYASIKEQQVGGFTQVGAHGTGAGIPPVDEQVVALKLMTPGRGMLTLKADDKEPLLFKYCRLGLGALGVVTQVTLQCVPAHKLLEHTFVTTREDVKRNHKKWLQKHQHLRYMWIPYTNSVVVVYSNPTDATRTPRVRKTYTKDEQLEPLRNLYLEKLSEEGKEMDQSQEDIQSLSWTELRDELLLAGGVLDQEWVKRVNKAEEEYWKRSEGYRIDWSDKILGFDCGGQQHVLEVAFPAGSLKEPNGADIRFMEDLLKRIEEKGIAAPSPLEQRWSCGSSSPMSPVYDEEDPQGNVYSWVGIIMYLPTQDELLRNQITDAFQKYSKMMETELMPQYSATYHWAKIEVPMEGEELGYYQRFLARRYPLTRFNYLRVRLDPRNIMSNRMINAGFSTPLGTWYM
eukprot:TRINITY_DN24904_c0_g1_i1.p1 TRINITY_DN24904_c0_g1~~TRINITY_DN24904_c0_g1_i1.p1  ORF type:complete len:658 (-),score=88.13 TRINITY_DN24904_c0_g1_i1:404-2377(-)